MGNCCVHGELRASERMFSHSGGFSVSCLAVESVLIIGSRAWPWSSSFCLCTNLPLPGRAGGGLNSRRGGLFPTKQRGECAVPFPTCCRNGHTDSVTVATNTLRRDTRSDAVVPQRPEPIWAAGAKHQRPGAQSRRLSFRSGTQQRPRFGLPAWEQGGSLSPQKGGAGFL